MDYFDWNLAIARHFFNGDMAGCPVYLNVSEGLINELGAQNSKSIEDYKEALKVGPPGVVGQGRPGFVCDKALKILQDWRAKGFAYPPYIAYLALFVLAANKDGDNSLRGYHPRLRQLLDPNDESKAFFPSFEKTYQLWSDLEQWANKDQQGQLGFFNADIVGNHFHIGLPRGQILLMAQWWSFFRSRMQSTLLFSKQLQMLSMR